MGMNNDYIMFLRLKITDKILSNGVLKSKIGQFYEAVVISKVGPNWFPGSSLKDL